MERRWRCGTPDRLKAQTRRRKLLELHEFHPVASSEERLASRTERLASRKERLASRKEQVASRKEQVASGKKQPAVSATISSISECESLTR